MWRGWMAPAAIFVLALAVRLVYLAQTLDSPLLRVNLTDAEWHVQWAQDIAAGRLSDGAPFFRAPLYPFFLAGASALAGGLVGARLVQHLIGAVTCVLVLWLGQRAFGRGAGVLAGVIAALYGPLVYYGNELLLPVLEAPLVLALLLLAARAAEGRSWRAWMLAGVVGGLGAITRPNLLLLLPVAALWRLTAPHKPGRWRDAAALLAGAAAAVAPVTLHNVLIGGDAVLIATQGGVNFWIGNSAGSDGRTAEAPLPPGWVPPQGRYVDNVRAGSRQAAEYVLGRPMRESEVDRFWLGEGLRFWRAQPREALGLTWRKLLYFFNGFEIESNRSIYLDQLFSPLAGWLTWVVDPGPAVPLGLVMPLGLVGMFVAGRDARLTRVMRWSLVVYALSVIAFFVTGRFRMPIVPLLIIFAAGAVVSGLHLWRSGRRRELVRPALAAALLLLVCNVDVYGVRDVRWERQASLLGEAWGRLGRPDLALAHFREAAEIAPQYFGVHMAVAHGALRLGRLEEAEAALRRALVLAPELTDGWLTLADVLAAQERGAEALGALRTAEAGLPPDSAYHEQIAAMRARIGG